MWSSLRRPAFVAVCVACGSLIVVPGASAACGPVQWRTLRDGIQRCPRTHGLLSDWTWQQLRWSTWNGTRAVGHGIAVHRTGSTVDERDLIQIRLLRVRRCPDEQQIYTRISVTWYQPNGVQHLSWSYYCAPRLVSGGGGGGG